MKHVLLLLVLMSICLSNAFAQNGPKKFDANAFRAEQERIIKQEVNLTPEEANAFFPLYHEMNKKRFEANRDVRKEMKEILSSGKITDAQYLKMVDNQLDVKVKENEIEKEYYAKFKKILPAEKVFKVSMAEMKMNKELLKTRDKR